MLVELSIKDFAIIDEISIPFQEGLTVLTGETGAGKSIIIDAIQLLVGGRGSVEYVRHQTDKAEIEGLFSIEDPSHPVFQKAKDLGIDLEDDGMLVLHRTMTSSGKSICRINRKLVTLGILREIGQSLIDVHSQHESQQLMDVERHLEFLDLFDSKKMVPLLTDFQKNYSQFEQVKKRLKELSQNEQEMAQRIDLLSFQLKELQEAHLEPGEDEALEEKRNDLLNFEKYYEALQQSYEALHGENRALDWLSHAMTSLEPLKNKSTNLQKKIEDFTSAYYFIEEFSFEIRNDLDSLEYDPDQLDDIEDRLNELHRLKRKYGYTVEEIIDYAATIENELDELTHRETHVANLEKQIEMIQKDLLLEAKQIHDVRLKMAEKIVKEIHDELKDLYLEKTKFDIEFQTAEKFLTKKGIDRIRFLISTNPGEPLKDLNKVASGGELSRIMLALKQIFSRHQKITSVIFDEVDTGVSGRVAQAIAEKIYSISTHSQVLCISHLPQVASMADTHYRIEKDLEKGRTKTKVVTLTKNERIEEISRMMTGAEMTELTKEHAKELLSLAHSVKTKNHYVK
ncbi:DNA repair protein RecN [Bacillaceae bacterium S4-13-58]